MLLAAKVALGLSATLAMSTAYVFHEGVIRVDVDEARHGGSHVHFWVPATAVSLGLSVTPRRHLEKAAREVRPYLPVLRSAVQELKRYQNAEFVDVQDKDQHVHIGMQDGKLQIDAVQPDESVHVRIPIETIEDVADHLESVTPTI